MVVALTTFINGISQGSVYALIALGYTMVYGIAKMLNFAHGDLIMVGAYAILVFLNVTGVSVVSILLSVLICILLGIAVEFFAYRPLRGASPLAVLITAIGVSYFLQSLADIVFGSAPKMVGDFIDVPDLKIGALELSGETLLTLGVAAVVMVILTLFVKKTKAGKAMLAVSEDKGAAQLMGINPNKIIVITFAIGSALAAIAGAFYMIKTPQVSPTLGAMPGIKAFVAAVIGGIGSIPGAMIGGILLGVIETVCNAIPALSNFTIAIEFGLLIVILLFRPVGILGKKRREKV